MAPRLMVQMFLCTNVQRSLHKRRSAYMSDSEWRPCWSRSHSAQPWYPAHCNIPASNTTTASVYTSSSETCVAMQNITWSLVARLSRRMEWLSPCLWPVRAEKVYTDRQTDRETNRQIGRNNITTKQPNNQTTNQPTNQPSNQPTNQTNKQTNNEQANRFLLRNHLFLRKNGYVAVISQVIESKNAQNLHASLTKRIEPVYQLQTNHLAHQVEAWQATGANFGDHPARYLILVKNLTVHARMILTIHWHRHAGWRSVAKTCVWLIYNCVHMYI